ncbi:hypothetical protein K5X82_16230 [Halosquirtibacter xylanolyticus]|uniref:hypothetical protein n=1 Tax=Halosquirtibacter xylanolyticus TaxID=3374599 RepID=UPI00374A59CF|nr:hypothetical protein K5X82_16230 [Prolixibacteraceae bacterium]
MKKKVLHEDHHHIEIPHDERIHLDLMFLKKPIYTISLVLGIVLLILEILLAHVTFMPTSIRILLFILPALFVVLLLRDKIHPEAEKRREKWLHMAVLYIGIGSLGMFLFTGVNYVAADKEPQTIKVPIVSQRTEKFENHNIELLSISYMGVEKEVLLNSKSRNKMPKDSLYITIKNGLFGFAILKSHQMK